MQLSMYITFGYHVEVIVVYKAVLVEPLTRVKFVSRYQWMSESHIIVNIIIEMYSYCNIRDNFIFPFLFIYCDTHTLTDL